jgi:PAS domain S-box-containing protein
VPSERVYGGIVMSDTRGPGQRSSRPRRRVTDARKNPARALEGVASDGPRVVLFGLSDVPDESWAVLGELGIRVERVRTVPAALSALSDGDIAVVIAGARWAHVLTAEVRSRHEWASTHIVVAAALDSPGELREALESGADDVMRVPFEPEVLVARVRAGLQAARLRANEALLSALVANIPGALYRCACDSDWTMEWLSDEIETISGYPASDFIHNSVRTFASVIHPDDRKQVERLVTEAVSRGRPFSLEYRIQRRDGQVRWALERGQADESGGGRRWLDGAIFDITVRRAAEQALRESEVVNAQLVEVQASRARILESADRVRREIERNLHDGAQQRFVSVTLDLRRLLGRCDLPVGAREDLETALTELRVGLAELRDLAHGLHPAVLTRDGLERALTGLADHATVPVELRLALPQQRLATAIEAAAYFTVSEALTNVAKYAHATCGWVDVQQLERCLRVEVGDDGAGGAALRPGSGLQGLSDRIAAVNGTLTIDSPPGAGTIVRARLPLD